MQGLSKLFFTFTVLFGLSSLGSSAPDGISIPLSSLPFVMDSPKNLTFIMDNSLEYIDGAVLVYSPDQSIVFRVIRHMTDPDRGISQYIITDGIGQAFFYLNSYDDRCGEKTHYIEANGQITVKIHPRGMKSDKWYFSSPQITGVKYKFDRNAMDKGGLIIQSNSKKVVADLAVEKRSETWIRPLFHSQDAYVLNTDQTVPAAYLVTLMGLVHLRVDRCGL